MEIGLQLEKSGMLLQFFCRVSVFMAHAFVIGAGSPSTLSRITLLLCLVSNLIYIIMLYFNTSLGHMTR